MKTALFKSTDAIITWFSKRLAKTGCFLGCNAPDIPDELMK
ncbi:MULTISPECIES: hypothetical protein [Paenibacillus]|uniref:Cyclic lactone autoinducer peptide n=1 Tax=Paenibacillus ehimensis TaxID=79264 RepID=A0ABT8VI78_9BACL|nr:MULTISPECIES: hypothetical protein [Paenibacillus]MDO3680663.1 hypothetical protein [Paenibacillus ehimensis]